MNDYKHPPIFADTLILYREYYTAHGNMPKLFRITIGENILDELSVMMRYITMVNFNKNEKNGQKSVELLQDIRGRIEVVKTYFLLGWQMKFISNGFYANLSKRIISISKQATKWQQFLLKD